MWQRYIVDAFSWKEKRTGQCNISPCCDDCTHGEKALEEVSLVESFSQARLLRPLPGQRQRAFTEFPQYYNNMDRVSALSDILAQDPNNTFARYGLAMEYANSGQADRALEEFEKLLSSNPDYAAGYFMAAQTLVKAGRAEEAKKKLVDGIAAAGRKRDAHAESEMQAMLQEIGG